MEKPVIHLYLRHHIHDAATLERYRDIVFRALKAAKHPSFSITVVLGIDSKLPVGQRDEITKTSRKLTDEGVLVNQIRARGAGHAFLHVLGHANVEMSPKEGIICLIDADQFLFDEDRFHEQLDKLASSMIREGRLVGMGIREKISLGEGELNEYRQIDEMFYAIYVKRRVTYKNRAHLAIPDAYKELGDPLPGCYCFNLAHPKLPNLIAECMKDAKLADLEGFAGDPYIMLIASKYGRVITEIMPTRDNPPGFFTLKDIERKSHEIGKTSLRGTYKECIISENNIKRIQKYYNKDHVLAVQQMLMRGMG